MGYDTLDESYLMIRGFLRSLAFTLALSSSSFFFSQTLKKVETATQAPPSIGHFIGTVKAEWSPDGRRMKLLDDFSYVDPDGLEWKAPVGLVTDGASIPKFAWSIIGGPFEGVYRNAAVVHDAACDKKDRSWESVHEMFYRAMLTSHVDVTKAKLMYAAVYHFGPRWELVRKIGGIDNANLSAAVASVQSETGSTNSQTQISKIGDDKSKTIVIRLSPTPKRLTQSEFSALRKKIVSEERVHPNSVTLEEIRNFTGK